jgi:hypothetical protein
VTSDLADRLAKLLRLACSTGPDGEKLAAVNRIAALVAAHDLDWDQILAANGAQPLAQDQLQKVYDAGYERGDSFGYQRGFAQGQRAAHPQPPDWASVPPQTHSYEYLEPVITAARSAPFILNDFETQFVESLHGRIRKYGPRTFVSPKQWAVLDRLAQKLERYGYDVHAS